MPAKKIYIQNRETREFLRTTNQWVNTITHAKRFNSAVKAYDFAVINRIPDIEIVFQQSTRIESILKSNNSRHPGHLTI